jgi:hypothetical protein
VEVTREGAPFTVDVADLPTDAASAVGKASIGDRSMSGRLQGSEGQKVRLRQYARAVDQALRGVLSGLELPLILAATEPLDSIYRGLNSYPHLVEPGIASNPDRMSDIELAAEARTVLDKVYADEIAAMGDLYEVRSSQGRVSSDIDTAARAATHGAVDTLLVDIDAQVQGELHEETGAVTFSDGDDAETYGVIDEIARRVMLNGGRVLAVRDADVPGGGPVAAILRYAA